MIRTLIQTRTDRKKKDEKKMRFMLRPIYDPLEELEDYIDNTAQVKENRCDASTSWCRYLLASL